MHEIDPKDRASMHASPTLPCPSCGSKHVDVRWETQHFAYGVGDDAVEIHCQVPVCRCAECELAYTGAEAEDRRHAAVCRHLGVLTPEEVTRLRSERGMTQSEFAELTGIGTASLGRWEHGRSIQTKAMDRYLRLLLFPENTDRLLRLAEAVEVAPPDGTMHPRFRVLEVTDHVLRSKASFHLRRTG